MTIAALISMLGAAMGIVVAGLAFGFSTAPGWRDTRWFAVVGVGSGFYTGLNSLATLRDVPERYIVATSPWLVHFAMLYAVGLLFYSCRRLQRKLGKLDYALAGAAIAVGLVSLIPGAAFTGEVFYSDVRWLGLRYVIARTSLLGDVSLMIIVAISITCFVYFLRALRKGGEGLQAHCLGVGLMMVTILVDSITSTGVINMPYVADAGFVVLVALVGANLTGRFVGSATALDQLKNELELRVEQRTGQLAEVNEQLMRAEKLAALGQLSAGVAHEINNPAAAVSANLKYLERALQQGKVPDDARASIAESLDSVRRIARVVRQLLDAGRSAAAAAKPTELIFNVRNAFEASVRLALRASERKVDIQLDVPKSLRAVGEQHVLEQVFTNVIVNAIHAIPKERTDGRIQIHAHETSTHVVVSVKDNGIGMSDETQRRVFEPFFTTRSLDEGTGLGLPVSLGLLRAVDGNLSFESELGIGTTASIELQRAPELIAQPRGHAVAEVPQGKRRSLLLIEDDSNVRNAVSRLLSDRFEVLVCEGPTEALGVLEKGRFDVVLCDVMMSGEGGPGFYRELQYRDPGLAKRVIFFTAGITNAEHRAFIEHANVQVLHKPIDVSELVRFAEGLPSIR
ncbi:MAG: response regulator [Sandaracinaceae bacterium]|nr:response regulator [Sandaracinaceae bacterium]